MSDRIQRYVIPATLVIMSAFMTVWLGARPIAGASIFKDLLDLGNAGIVTAVIAIGVTNYGLGYICHAAFRPQ